MMDSIPNHNEFNSSSINFQQSDEHFFPTCYLADDVSYVGLHIKLSTIIYEMKCARSKKLSQNISSNYLQSITPKFNCSKVTLMKFRNSLFANVKFFYNQQHNQSEKCLKLSVSYSAINENLTISGVTFNSDGRRKSFLQTSIQSESDDYSRIHTEHIFQVPYPGLYPVSPRITGI